MWLVQKYWAEEWRQEIWSCVRIEGQLCVRYSTTYCRLGYHEDLQISPDAFVTVTPVRMEVESARLSLMGPSGAMWMRRVAARTSSSGQPFQWSQEACRCKK